MKANLKVTDEEFSVEESDELMAELQRRCQNIDDGRVRMYTLEEAEEIAAEWPSE